MMRIFKAIITPLILFSVIFSPIMTGAALAVTREECEAQNKQYVSGGGYTYCTDLVDESTSESKGEKFISENLQKGSSIGLKGDNKIGSCTVVETDFLSGIISSGISLLGANVIISLLNGVPYVGGAAEPFDDALDQLNSAWIGAALWGTAASVIIWIEGYLIQLAFLLNSNITTDNPVITTGFNVTLGIVNIGFVIVLVLMGIMTILRRTNWLAQKRLPNLILAVVLVNFSLFIAGLLINISNVFTGALLANSCATNLFGYLNVGAVFTRVQPALGSVLNPLVGTGGIILAALFSIIGALTLGAIFLFLIIRYVMIVILLVFMPIAWLGFVVPEIEIPGIGNPWKKWWGEFTKWLIVGPIIAFSLYLTLTLLQNMGEITSKATKIPLTGVALDGLLNITAAMIMSLLGIFIAIKGSGVAGALIAGGLATGTAFAAKGLQSVGGRLGFGGQLKLEDRAKKLREEAEKAEEKGDIGKAQSLRRRAMAAEKFAAGAGALGKGAAVTPTGLGFGLGGKLLEQAGVKGIKPSGEITSAQAWREAAVKKASARYAGMSEDERKREIREVTGELSKGALPGRKIELYNRYAALAQTMAKDGKLSDEMLNTIMREDFQKQSSLMGVSVDISETLKKLPADQLAKKISTLNILKTKEGIDKKAIEKAQVEAIRQLQSKKKLGEITDPNSVRTVYSLKDQIEKKDGAGSFRNYELAFGVNKESADVFYEATDRIRSSDNRTSEINTQLAELASKGAPATSPEYVQLQNELGKIRVERQQAEQKIGDQTRELAKWMADLKPEESKKIPLDKLFSGNMVPNIDAQQAITLRENFIDAAIKKNPTEINKLTNVRSENYEIAAKTINERLDRAMRDPANATDQALLNALDSSKKSLVRSASRRGISI